MKRIKGMKYYSIAAAIVLLAVFVAVPVGAKGKRHDLNRLLTGDYAANSSFVCAEAIGGFDEDFNRNPDPTGFISKTFSGSYQGVISYDGEGGLTFQGQVLAVYHDPGVSSAPLVSPVSQGDMKCWGTYQVNQDLSTGSEMECEFYPLAGPFAPPSYPANFYIGIKGLSVKGQLLGTMGNILVLRSDTEPNVEELYFYNFAPIPVKVAERICTSSGTAMKIVGKGN